MKLPSRRTAFGLLLLWPVWLALILIIGVSCYQLYMQPIAALTLFGLLVAFASTVAGVIILVED